MVLGFRIFHIGTLPISGRDRKINFCSVEGSRLGKPGRQRDDAGRLTSSITGRGCPWVDHTDRSNSKTNLPHYCMVSDDHRWINHDWHLDSHHLWRSDIERRLTI